MNKKILISTILIMFLISTTLVTANFKFDVDNSNTHINNIDVFTVSGNITYIGEKQGRIRAEVYSNPDELVKSILLPPGETEYNFKLPKGNYYIICYLDMHLNKNRGYGVHDEGEPVGKTINKPIWGNYMTNLIKLNNRIPHINNFNLTLYDADVNGDEKINFLDIRLSMLNSIDTNFDGVFDGSDLDFILDAILYYNSIEIQIDDVDYVNSHKINNQKFDINNVNVIETNIGEDNYLNNH